MEADWEVEIGGDAPVIDACWDGFVDLRQSPSEVFRFSEAQQLIVLAEVLKTLNAPNSPVWTSKCDVWQVGPGDFDIDELDADPSSADFALACYIDLLPSSDGQWSDPAQAVASCQRLCSGLKQVALGNCRTDLIVRQARITPETWSHGITAYFTACGPTIAQATGHLSVALRTFVTHLDVQFDPAQR